MRNYKLSKILRITLVATLVVLTALLIWGIVLFVIGLNIQWWAKAMILTCFAATLIAIVLLRKLWIKRREMKFVEGIVGTDMPGNISALDDASQELRRRFKEAVSTLKKSHLKGKGNPLYVLPWYLMVGRSGAGKSTAIKSARLPSPFGDINRISGIEGTRNCDWWFFDDSVVIDIAGRYSVHRNENLDKHEWLTFLEHLVKYRKKEPLNGVIVTVEADHLLQGDLEKIEEEGRSIRKRIDEVMNVMGAKFPIYLLVTKCDLVYGMNRYCHLLSEDAAKQAMGWMNHDGETDITVIVDNTITNLVNKLKDIRLILVNKEEVGRKHYLDPEVLLFPDEMTRLGKGLQVFCNGAFKDNPFQELSPLRGIYFCSGEQTGVPVTSSAGAFSNLGSQELPGTGNGFFLHDFFAKILPADRPLYSMTRQAREWHRLTHNLWLTGFVTAVLIFCILLTHSWNENKAAVNTLSPEYKQTILFKNDLVTDIGIMSEFGQQIKKIEQINKTWKTPRLGLKASLTLEKDLKKRYCARFYEHFDADINIKIESLIANGGWEQNDFEPAMRYLPFIVRRINLLNAKFKGSDQKQLAAMPDPDYVLMLTSQDNKPLNPDVLKRYKDAYLNYLIWQKDVEVLNKTLSGMQRLLGNYFNEDKVNLRWLANWANVNLRGKALTMNTIWRGRESDSELSFIAPAFRSEGRKLIGKFVTEELELAVGDNLKVIQPKEHFVTWYQDAYYGAWMQFCLDFVKGKSLFKNTDEQSRIIERLSSTNNPYMDLIETMEKELFPLPADNSWPSLELVPEIEKKYGGWLEHLQLLGLIRQAAQSDAVTDNPAMDRLGNKLSGKTRFAIMLAGDAMDKSKLTTGKEAFKRYQEALQLFSGIASSKAYAYQVARGGFEDNPAEAQSPLFSALKAMKDLREILDEKEPINSEDNKDPFWCLLEEPVNEVWEYCVEQAGSHLQDLWDQNVTVKIQGVSDRQRMTSIMFGNKGCVNNYMNTDAKMFLGQNSTRGYYPKQLNGAEVPFTKDFFHFLKKGKRWDAATSKGTAGQSQSVTIIAYPTDVNAEARIRPYMTRLVLEGAEGPSELENRQYPIEGVFHWNASSSGDVALEIVFENITLRRNYRGYCAFGKFLREFAKGRKVFKPKDFPSHAAELEMMGIEEIEVVYNLQGSQIRPIIRLLETAPGQPPRQIIASLNNG